MRPAMYVRQKENGLGDFWYVVKSGNGTIMAASEMFPTRSNAKRGARAFIRVVRSLALHGHVGEIVFSYWAGPVPPLRGKGYRLVEEVIR